MAVHPFDYQMLGDLFVSPEIRKVFEERAILQAWLDVEAALARSQAQLRIIPVAAAEQIASQARIERFDLETLRRRVGETAHPLVPLIEELARLSGSAGGYVHWGATTQDIIDTGMALCLKRTYEIVRRDLAALIRSLANLAQRHRSTPMAGRTHGQHAAPITFGFKVAVWLSECLRHLDRFDESRPRVLVGQLSGAVGTMAGFGPEGREIQRLALTSLGLAVPDIAWHNARDSIGEFVNLASLIGASLGKFANEIVALQRSEIGEVEEPFAMGKIGSSTMPHKRNPIFSETIVAASRLLRARAGQSTEAIGQLHERDGTMWLGEWVFVPEAACLVASIVAGSLQLMQGLVVHADRMTKNLDALEGLICSEPIMLEIAGSVGRQAAHEIVYNAAMHAVESGGSFRDHLLAVDCVRQQLGSEGVARLTDPTRYLGLAEQFVDEMVMKALKTLAGA